jgi:hypothetical protein
MVALTLAVATLPTTSTAAPASAPSAVVVPTWKPVPSYAAAARDEPVTYRNGCHAPGSVTKPKPCTFGVKSGSRTVLLLGDSHAAHWHAAVLGSARSHGWRMRTLTKSGCPAADVPVRRYRSTSAYPECQKWRARALTGLASSRWGKVDVVVLSNWHFHAVLSSVRGSKLSASAKAAAWESGMRRTLSRMLAGVRQVVILRDSPDLPGSIAGAKACFKRHGLAAQTRCGGPTSRTLKADIWTAERRAAASFPGRVVAVDLTTPTCGGGWCGPIDKPYLMFKDDNHWTQTYMRAHFSAPVDRAISAAMNRA